jgi:hypothetical protein
MAAKRAVLLIPSSRKVPTYAAMRELERHWHLTPVCVVTYSDLSSRTKQDILLQINPDLIIADEAQNLKDGEGARWTRVKRVDPGVPFVAMSGSFANRDLTEYRHLCVRALGQAAPVPIDWIEGQLWSRGLNPNHSAPLEPGALLTLMPDVGPDEDARRVFGRRMVSAPGVVSSGSDIPDIPLTFARVHVPATSAMKEAENHIISNWETPCGFPIDAAIDMWRHLRELSHGLYYRWAEIPPVPWLAARKAESAFVRAAIKAGKGYDLPSQVRTAVTVGELADDGSVTAWRAVEDTYTPVMQPVWCDDSTLDYAAAWLAREGGIAWVSVSEFGDRLAQRTGLPYFRGGACDEAGTHIEHHRGACIASVSSCSTGHNLQWAHRNLVIGVPPPIQLEQLISRTHRDGQTQPVHVEFLLRLSSDAQQLDRAIEDAASVSHTFHVIQRLIYGEWV